MLPAESDTATPMRRLPRSTPSARTTRRRSDAERRAHQVEGLVEPGRVLATGGRQVGALAAPASDDADRLRDQAAGVEAGGRVDRADEHHALSAGRRAEH